MTVKRLRAMKFSCALLSLVLMERLVSADDAVAGTTGGDSNEVKVLKAQVENLVEALAAVRSEADSLRSIMADREFGKYAAVGLKPAPMEAADSTPPRLVGVSAELRMVVLDRGARRGIQPGMKFGVLRADKVIAEIETVDVRETIAGAVVVRHETGMLPEIGDRLTEIAGLTK